MAEPELLKYKISARPFLIVICLTLFSSCVTGQKNFNVEKLLIDIQIEECIKIMPNGLIHKNDSVYLNTKWKYNKSSGNCGCKSALLSYRIVAKYRGANSILYNKEITSLGHDEFDFIICSDSQKGYESYRIDIQCKNPN